MIKANYNYELISKEYPHISKKLEIFWGDVEFNKYVNHLLNDTRDGIRQGFPKEVASALFKLLLDHESQFPNTKKREVVDYETNYGW